MIVKNIANTLFSKFTFLGNAYQFNRARREAWVKIQSTALPAGSSVLDVGAGTAPFRKYFTHCDYKTHDFKKLDHGKLQDGEKYYDADFVSDILDIPVQQASYNAILCTEVLEHVPEPIAAIQEFSRILKPGGKLLLSCPLGSGIHQEPFHFYAGYTPYWYQKFLSSAGFSNISITPNGGFFSLMGQELLRSAIQAPLAAIRNKNWRTLPLIMLTWPVVLPAAFLIPLLSSLFYRLDPAENFTVGYFVSATKANTVTHS